MPRDVHQELIHAAKHGHLNEVEDRLIEGANPNRPDHLNNNALHHSARHGSWMVTQILLENDDICAEVDKPGWNKRTALHFACFAGNAQVVNLLLSFGADVDVRDEDSNTPLHLAIYSGKDSVVSALFDYGANVNVHGWYGWTPCHFCVDQGMRHLLKSLCHKGAVPDLEDEQHDTPLHLAIGLDAVESAQILLQAGSKIEVFNKFGMSPLHVAAVDGNLPMMQLLLQFQADVNMRDAKGKGTPLHYAASLGHTAIIKALARAGCDPNVQDKDGETPLYAACQSRMGSAVAALDSIGSDPNIVNKHGRLPLHVSAAVGDVPMVRVLLNSGQRPDLGDNHGLTAIHLAAWNCHIETLKAVLFDCSDANIDCRDSVGRTALHVACQYSNADTVELLIESGADANLVDNAGQGVLHYVAIGGTAGLLSIIPHDIAVDAADKDDMTAMHVACRDGALDIVRGLCTRHANCSLEDKNNENSMHYASRADWGTVINARNAVTLLLNAEADCNRLNADSMSPMMIAAEKGSNAVVEQLLVSRKVARDQADQHLDTALHHAIKNGHTFCADALIKAEANCEISNREGQTPLHYAAKYGRHQCIMLLASLRQFSIDKRDRHDNTAFVMAAEQGDIGCMKALEALGANMFHANKEGKIALHNAASFGHAELARWLCMRDHEGLSHTVRDVKGNQPLHYACQNGHNEAIKVLLTYGAETSARGQNGWTAMHCAAFGGSVATVTMLEIWINHYCPSEFQLEDDNGNTALHVIHAL